jgi:hypothetical protein
VKSSNYINYTKEFNFEEGNIKLSFPAHAFYQSFNLSFEIDSSEQLLSPVYKVHNRFTPVHKAFSIKVQPDSIPDELRSKMYMAYSNGNGSGYYGFLSAKWNGDYLTAKSRTFGNYKIKIDTVAPAISPVNIGEGKDVSGQKTIKIKIWDTETGIRYFRVTINGRWILMEYDPKKRLLTYNYDQSLQKGENDFKLIVEDMLRNKKTYSAKLYY